MTPASSALTSRGSSENFKFFEGDICDKDFITRVFETEQPRWMLHLAARAGVLPSIENPFVSSTRTSRRRRACSSSRVCTAASTSSSLFASSSSVYGGSRKSLFSEADDVSNPASSC